MKRQTKKKLKIAVAMSGGVDSSVAAKLLKDKGHEVVGIFLHFWKEGIKAKNEEAFSEARRAASKIGVPLYVLDFSAAFKKQVVDNFLSEYDGGRTPNPCVRCNKLVKLGLLIEAADKLGFNYVATGHYVKNKNGKLYKAEDKEKDQSYFLYTLDKKELKRLLFPLGNYTKPQVRKMAKKFGLPAAEKKDSQEICFIPEKSHNEFLRRHLKLKPGPIKTFDGKTVGQHKGLPLYTIGQRKGIEIGGTGPYYAAKMDYKKNVLYVVIDGNDKRIYDDMLIAKNVNWVSGNAPSSLKCQAVIRYHHKPVDCKIKKITKHNFKVIFSEPQRAITSGQSVVFYRGAEVLGGGIID